MSEAQPVAIIGAGPAGLIAADVVSAAGLPVLVFDRMPSVGRKFLMAGRGGLNLTHAEPFDAFAQRYGAAAAHLRPMLDGFSPSDLITWANGLGAETFVGSSGRVFPKAMKASPLLRAWLARLEAQGVDIRTRMRWTGWDQGGALSFIHDNGERHSLHPSATLLTLGGASWPKLGSDGAWFDILQQRGVPLIQLAPANMGFETNWTPFLKERFAGVPLKQIGVRFGDRRIVGEAMITAYGLEGGAIYALSSLLRDAIATDGAATIHIDLKPQLSTSDVRDRVTRAAKPSDTFTTRLRKALALPPAAISLLYETPAQPEDSAALATLIKNVPITLTRPRGLDRAISTAGGVAWTGVAANLELKALPKVFVAGEMLDWEAPTGGYLLQATFATAVHAARGIIARARGLAAPAPR